MVARSIEALKQQREELKEKVDFLRHQSNEQVMRMTVCAFNGVNADILSQQRELDRLRTVIEDAERRERQRDEEFRRKLSTLETEKFELQRIDFAFGRCCGEN
jgi:chromosome segregation ATPase